MTPPKAPEIYSSGNPPHLDEIRRRLRIYRVSAVAPKPETSDVELFWSYRAGAAEAFDRLYARHKDALYHHARSLVRDEAAAEDLVNETFLKLVRTPEFSLSQTRSPAPGRPPASHRRGP